MKKLLALLTALTLALSLFAVAPVMATGEEGEAVTPELTIYEQIRKETNRIVNGDLEAEKFNDPEDKTSGKFGYRFTLSSAPEVPEYSISTKESYSGDKSLFAKCTGGYNNLMSFANGGIRPGATYIASLMALGTVVNKGHWDAVGANLKGGKWEPRFTLAFEGRDNVGTPISIGDDIDHAITDINANGFSRSAILDTIWFPLSRSYSAAANSDTTAEKTPTTGWTKMYTTIEVKSNKVQTLGVGMGITLQKSGFTDEQKKDPAITTLEMYADDYYIGELMVADIVLNNEKAVNAPSVGSATLELSAQAYNQIENTVGLENAEYTYELVGDSQGAYIIDNKLTVTSSAQKGNLIVRVTAIPKFYGADTQSANLTKYRTKDFNIAVTKASDEEFFASVLNGTTNYVGAKAGLESYELNQQLAVPGTDDKYLVFTTNRKNTYTVTDKQVYNGGKAVLTSVPTNGGADEGLAMISTTNRDKTILLSAMVLGTAKNKAAVEANPDAKLEVTYGYYPGDCFYPRTWATENIKFESNSVLLSDMLDTPASTDEQVAADKSAWKMVHGIAVYPTYQANGTPYNDGKEGRPTTWYTGMGVVSTGKDVEYYIDDYYASELIVAKVESATQSKVKIGEVSEIELKATAYNQIGTTDYFGEGSTYTWEKVSAPEGVEVVGDKLTIADNAKAGKAVLNVTFNPTFVGEAEQTAEQKAARKATVVIDIVEKPGFEFAEADGAITAAAKVGNLAEDAKAYCALYKVLDGGAKKLMNIESKDVVAGGENVSFTAISTPDYDYEIKCFMWYEGTMKNVIPAAAYPQN